MQQVCDVSMSDQRNWRSQNILIILLHSSVTSLMKDTTKGKICKGWSRTIESHKHLQSHWRATSGCSTLESGIWNGGQKRFCERDIPKYTILKFLRLVAATKEGTLLSLICIFANRCYRQLERSTKHLIFMSSELFELRNCYIYLYYQWAASFELLQFNMFMTGMFGSMAYRCHYNIS